MQDTTLDRWKTRFAKAARLIEGRLDDPPPLEELAAAAAVSPHHFHRIWRALTGETVSQSVLRLRIEASLQMLAAAGGGTVTEIALASGFGTPQSFARAFRRQTGSTPTAYRQEASGTGAPEAPAIEIVARDRTLVVALRHRGDPIDLDRTFGEIWGWADQAGLLTGLQGIYGIPLDDPDSVPLADGRFEACLALGDGLSPPAPFRLLTLPGGEAARMRHVGSYAGLDDARQRMVEEWLLPSGREPADHPIYSHYLNDPDVTPEAELITDLHLPLAAS